MIIQHINTPVKRLSKETHTACPFCGGKDRFVIFNEANTAWCRQCNWSGDEIQLLRDRDGLTYAEACERLRITPKEYQPQAPRRPSLSVSTPRQHEHNVVAWRKSAKALWQRAFDYLIENIDDNPAQAFLSERNLTLAGGRFGYVPVDYKANWGGLDVFIPSGLLIGWFDGSAGDPYKINIRRLDPKPNERKYHMVKGSENGMYLSHLIPLYKIAILCEGELDSIAIWQAMKGTVAPVATGSTMGGRLQKYIALLATRSRVLVAFDNDDAGEEASKYWLDLLPNAKRLRPVGAKDAGEMKQLGYDLNEWIVQALWKDMK